VEDRSKTAAPLSVALLGYGFASKTFHAPLLTHVPGLRLTHIVSSDSAKVKKDYDVTVLAKPEEAFALPEIDLIVLATPNITHFDLASKALNAGKHVVIDKPFTNTVAEATELIVLARKQRRLLSAFQSRRWDADFLTLRTVLAGGALGEIAHFESHYDRYRPEPGHPPRVSANFPARVAASGLILARILRTRRCNYSAPLMPSMRTWRCNAQAVRRWTIFT
jgi:predicted dehydrogenase